MKLNLNRLSEGLDNNPGIEEKIKLASNIVLTTAGITGLTKAVYEAKQGEEYAFYAMLGGAFLIKGASYLAARYAISRKQ